MIFPIPGGKKIGSHYLPRYTRYRVIAGRVIKGGVPEYTAKKDGKRIPLQEKISQGTKISLSKIIKWVLACKKQFILLNKFCKIIISLVF